MPKAINRSFGQLMAAAANERRVYVCAWLAWKVSLEWSKKWTQRSPCGLHGGAHALSIQVAGASSEAEQAFGSEPLHALRKASATTALEWQEPVLGSWCKVACPPLSTAQ